MEINGDYWNPWISFVAWHFGMRLVWYPQKQHSLSATLKCDMHFYHYYRKWPRGLVIHWGIRVRCVWCRIRFRNDFNCLNGWCNNAMHKMFPHTFTNTHTHKLLRCFDDHLTEKKEIKGILQSMCQYLKGQNNLKYT